VKLATILLAIAVVLLWAAFDYERRNRADVLRQQDDFDRAKAELAAAFARAFEQPLRKLNAAAISCNVALRRFADAFRAGPRP
jgi:hypothetical protein